MAKFTATAAAILVALAIANAGPIQRKLTPAQAARAAMSKTSWVSIATISSNDNTLNYPMVNVKSTADGGSGIPYLFFSDLDFSVIDINANPKVSILATLADSECSENSWDPQDPRCPRLILTGKVAKVEDEDERVFARNALIEKHPIMKVWESVHDFYISKLVIEEITFLDHFGGADHITAADYLSAEIPQE